MFPGKAWAACSLCPAICQNSREGREPCGKHPAGIFAPPHVRKLGRLQRTRQALAPKCYRTPKYGVEAGEKSPRSRLEPRAHPEYRKTGGDSERGKIRLSTRIVHDVVRDPQTTSERYHNGPDESQNLRRQPVRLGLAGMSVHRSPTGHRTNLWTVLAMDLDQCRWHQRVSGGILPCARSRRRVRPMKTVDP